MPFPKLSSFDFGDDDDAVEQLAVQNDRLVKVGQLIDCSSGFCLCPTKCTPLGDTDHCDDNDDKDERNYNNCYNDNGPTKNEKNQHENSLLCLAYRLYR